MNEELKHSVEYLNSKIHYKHGFSVPANYFKELETEISNTISEINLPKENNFDIPTDYFTLLEDTILDKINTEEHSTPKIISLKSKLTKNFLKIAAAIVIVFTTTYFIVTKTEDYNISTDEVVAWLENDYNTTTTYELAMLFDNEDFIAEEEIPLPINNDSDNIDAYFNTMDTSFFIEELQ